MNNNPSLNHENINSHHSLLYTHFNSLVNLEYLSTQDVKIGLYFLRNLSKIASPRVYHYLSISINKYCINTSTKRLAIAYALIQVNDVASIITVLQRYHQYHPSLVQYYFRTTIVPRLTRVTPIAFH